LAATSKRLSAGILALAVTGLMTAPVSAVETRIEGEYTIALTANGDLEHILRKFHLIPVDSFGPYCRVRVKDMDSPALTLEDLQNHAGVDWAEFARRQHTPESVRQMVVAVVGSSIEEYRGQKVYHHLDLGAIHALTQGENVTVAIVDTGVNYNHEALAGHVLPNGFDFVDNDADPLDTANGFDDDGDGQVDEAAGHGTLVAGTVLLTAPECNLLPVRVMDDEGNGTAFDVARGIFYAVDQGADVINLSLGLPEYSRIIDDAVQATHDAGIVMVAAAGNMGTEFPPYFPASSPFTLSVASVNGMDVKSDFSNYHKTVTMTAPGENILGPYWDGGWAVGAGTSFATPFVSGQIALVRSVRPKAHKAEMEGIAKSGTIGIDGVYGNDAYRGRLGHGRFDAKRTLEVIEPLVATLDLDLTRSGFGALPNPVPVGGTVQFVLPADVDPNATWDADVYDASGRHVRTLAPVAVADLKWDGTDVHGSAVPAGAYYVQLRGATGAKLETIRVVRVLGR